jgi:macrolide-specific efflux system membrane fusion protein
MAVEELADARRRIQRDPGGNPTPPHAAAGAVGFVRRHKWIAGALFVAIVVGVAYVAFVPGSTGEGEPIVVEATRGDVEDTVTALGALQPRDYVDVGAQVSGQLKTIAVKIGDRVEKGQFLAEIDSTVQAAKVQSGRDQLKGLQAQLAANLAQAHLTRAQLERQRGLLKIGGTSRDAFQIAEAAARSADAQVKALRAQIAQAQSTLNGDAATLGYSKIHAPIAGTVVSIAATPGQTLNASQTAPIIMRIADLSAMTVWTQVSEADVPKLSVGMDAYFTTLGSPGRRWQGKLRQILPTPEVLNNVVLFTALFDVANPNGALMPQMTAQVFFVAASARDVVTVPIAALHYGQPGAADGAQRTGDRSGNRDGNRSGARGQRRARDGANRDPQGRRGWVTVVSDSGSQEVRSVRVGVTNRVTAEIRSGLSAGERVVAGTKQDASATDRASQRERGGRGRGGFGGPRL